MDISFVSGTNLDHHLHITTAGSRDKVADRWLITTAGSRDKVADRWLIYIHLV